MVDGSSLDDRPGKRFARALMMLEIKYLEREDTDPGDTGRWPMAFVSTGTDSDTGSGGELRHLHP